MNSIQSNRPSKYQHAFSISSYEINRHIKLLNWFKQYHRRYSCQMQWPSSVISILDNVSNLCFVPTYLLAWTLCRSAELNQISLKQLQYFSAFEIKSSKSKHFRIVEPLTSFKVPLMQSFHPDTPVYVISYDQMRNSIKKARILCSVELPGGALNCTHIFRHLIATHMSKIGVSLGDISYKLGHSSTNTTLKYIHLK